MRKLLISLLLIVFLVGIIYRDGLCWDNKVTHKDLSYFATQNSVLSRDKGDYLKKIGFDKELLEVLRWDGSSTIKIGYITDWIQEGAFLEDGGSAWDAIKGAARYNNHFHNPLRPWSAAGLSDLEDGESSILWAQDTVEQDGSVGGDWSWLKVRYCFYDALTAEEEIDRQSFFACTFEGLGYQMHLIQDMTVPAHVRNDAHPEDAFLGTNYETLDPYLETWAKKNQGMIDSFAVSPAFPAVYLEISRNGLVPITQLIDSEQYTGSTPSTSLTLGLAEYTNSNFVSDDTIFTEDRDVNDKHYFPYPRYSTASYDMCEVPNSPITKRIYLRKRGDGESIEHFTTTGPLLKWLSFDSVLQKNEFKLDPVVYHDYAEKLIPRAVGYSAALINYFFRGDIDMIPDEANGSGYVIVNNTDEDMDGTFELWYDNKDDERHQVWSDSMSIGKKSSGNNKSRGINFTSPADAKDADTYLLVFKGRLGAEEGAVAGKKVKLDEFVTGRLVYAASSYDRKRILLNVHTESGLISAGFDINHSEIQAVRFNLSNYDEFIVAVHIGGTPNNNKIYKFTIDEPNMTINYDGIVAEYPESVTDDVTQHVCREEGSLDDCVYYDLYGDITGPFREIHFWHSYKNAYRSIKDVYYNGGSVKPFGFYAEDHSLYATYADYCGDREEWFSSLSTYESGREQGLYYGPLSMSTFIDDCVDHDTPQFSCEADWDRQCVPTDPLEIIEAYIPIAIFNSSAFAYADYRYPYGVIRTLTGCDYMADLISPVSIPCSTEPVKTMLRRDTGESFYYYDEGEHTWYSYSTGLGIVEGRYLVSNDNPSGKHIGWDDKGNIVRIDHDNGELKITKLKEIGGILYGLFDVALKFSN